MNKIVGAIDFEEVEMKLRKQQVEVMRVYVKEVLLNEVWNFLHNFE